MLLYTDLDHTGLRTQVYNWYLKIMPLSTDVDHTGLRLEFITDI